MALSEVKVTQGGGNVASDSAFYELVAQYNDLAEKFEALLQKLDADDGITDTDYESTVGESKKILFRETGAPTAS